MCLEHLKLIIAIYYYMKLFFLIIKDSLDRRYKRLFPFDPPLKEGYTFLLYVPTTSFH